MCRQRAGCNAGTLTARSLVEAAARDDAGKGLVAAAARELERLKGFRVLRGFKGLKGMKPGKQQA